MKVIMLSMYIILLICLIVYTKAAPFSTSIDLCGSDQEIWLRKTGEAASTTVNLQTIENKGVCKLRVVAPKTHVVNMQFVETISAELRRALRLNHSNAHPHPPCMMNVYLADNPRMPVWKGDLCSDEDLQDIDLLTPDFKIIWNPPANASFVNGKKFVITAVGQGSTCKEPGQHACMKIGWEPLLCISKQLLCDGNINCPSSSSNSDEDEKLCKKSHTKPTLEQIAVEMLKNLDPSVKNDGDKWIEEQLSKHLELNTKPSKPEPKKMYGNWRLWQEPKSKSTTTTTTTEKPDEKPKVKTIDSISAALSKYGPWGYLVLGTVICGGVLMICGLWECCFKRHKTQTTATQSTQPTTVLIINEEEIANSPPTYDELDQPPSYSTLFPPNTKEGACGTANSQSANDESGVSAHTQNSDSQEQSVQENSDSQTQTMQQNSDNQFNSDTRQMEL